MFKKTKELHPIFDFLIERVKDYQSIEFISSDRKKEIKIHKFRENGKLRIFVLTFWDKRIEEFLFFVEEKIVQLGKTEVMLRYSLENIHTNFLEINHHLDGLKILIEEATETRGHIKDV